MAPRNTVEQEVANLFGEFLRVERVGALDNFFDLGGHSLLATRVISRLQKKYEVTVQLRRFFETPTVEGLALAVSAGREEPEAASPPPIARLEGAGGAVPDVSGLSDEEVAAMLETLLTEGKDHI